MPQFPKEELHLLKLCFDINAGDFYARRNLFPEMVAVAQLYADIFPDSRSWKEDEQ